MKAREWRSHFRSGFTVWFKQKLAICVINIKTRTQIKEAKAVITKQSSQKKWEKKLLLIWIKEKAVGRRQYFICFNFSFWFTNGPKEGIEQENPGSTSSSINTQYAEESFIKCNITYQITIKMCYRCP